MEVDYLSPTQHSRNQRCLPNRGQVQPTGNLDRENSERVVTTLKDVAHVQGRAVVVITHDHNVAEQSDVIYTIDRGRLRAEAELR